MKITKRPPELSGEHTVTCSFCRCEFAVTNGDVTSFNFREKLIEGRVERLNEREWKQEVSDGYVYYVDCPICKNKSRVLDHLVIRIVTGPYLSDFGY